MSLALSLVSITEAFLQSFEIEPSDAWTLFRRRQQPRAAASAGLGREARHSAGKSCGMWRRVVCCPRGLVPWAILARRPGLSAALGALPAAGSCPSGGTLERCSVHDTGCILTRSSRGSSVVVGCRSSGCFCCRVLLRRGPMSSTAHWRDGNIVAARRCPSGAATKRRLSADQGHCTLRLGQQRRQVTYDDNGRTTTMTIDRCSPRQQRGTRLPTSVCAPAETRDRGALSPHEKLPPDDLHETRNGMASNSASY